MTAPVDESALALTHPTALDVLERYTHATPDVRRKAAAVELERRRADLAVLADLLRERDGHRAPSLDDLTRSDVLLVELATLAVA